MPNDPDAGVIAIFKMMAFKDEPESIKQGRPVFRDEEICELRYPGSKNVGCYPATGFSHWSPGYDGNQTKVTYAERFSRQYQQFKAEAVQTKAGTPLTYALFLTEARRAELRAQNIYTIEQLADIEGLELKNLGMGGRDFKNKAQEYLAETKLGAPNAMMMAELEALKARNELLEEDIRHIKNFTVTKDAPPQAGDKFDGMSLDQLREYIAANTGQTPHGSSNRKTLERLARDATSTTKAA